MLSILPSRPSIWNDNALKMTLHLHRSRRFKTLDVLAACVARRVEVGEVVLRADWLHPGHWTTTVRVAEGVDVVVPGLLEAAGHVRSGAAKLV